VKKIFPVFFIVLIWFLFFQKFFFKDLSPIPSDIIVGMYFPWLNEKWGTITGVPVKNPILSDTVSQFWIWRNWGVENLKKGKISIWNPYSFSGYPLSPWFHTILFSPLNIFYFFTDKLTAMGFIIAFQLLSGLIFMYVFLEELLKSKIAAIFGAISFSFSAFFLGWLSWGTVGWTAVFLPLALLFVKKIIDSTNPFIFFPLFVLVIVFSFLGGHPQTFFYVLIAVLLFTFLYWQRQGADVQKLKIIITAFLLSLVTVLPVLAPTFKILQNSIRGQERYLQNVNFGFLPLYKLIILFFTPNFFGNPGTGNYWGGGFNFQEYLAWFGTAGLIMALTAILNLLKKKDERFIFVLIFFLGILMSLKYPFGFLIYKLKIPFLSTGSASRALFLSAFSGAVLAAYGLKDLIRRKIMPLVFRRVFLFFAGLISGTGGSMLLMYLLLRRFVSFEDQLLMTDFFAKIIVGLRNLVIPISVTFFTIVSIFLTQRIKRIGYWLAVGLLVIAVGEGFYFGRKYISFSQKEWFFPETKITEFLKVKYRESHDFFRIEREKGELMPPNMWMAFSFYSTAGYDPVYPVSYADFLKQKGVFGDYSRYLEWDRDNKLFDFFGVKYFLVLKRTRDGKTDSDGSLPYWVDTKKWQTVFEDGAVAILENKNFSPPYFVINENGQKSEKAVIKLVEKEEDYWRFEVQTEVDGQFVLIENYFPGWKAKVNNKSVGVSKYEDTFKQVEIGKGKNEIEFYFMPS